MNVKFYYNESDDRAINKTITGETVFNGELRGEANIMNPVLRFQTADVIRFNYCYIEDFSRYYTISSKSAVSRNIFDITFEVDVLMSFRGDIMQLPCIINKQAEIENGDQYIDDSSLIADAMQFTTVHTFPKGFNDTPEFILITAG